MLQTPLLWKNVALKLKEAEIPSLLIDQMLDTRSQKGYNVNIEEWLIGGTGIHNRLKICRPCGLAGSSPASATILRREK